MVSFKLFCVRAFQVVHCLSSLLSPRRPMSSSPVTCSGAAEHLEEPALPQPGLSSLHEQQIRTKNLPTYFRSPAATVPNQTLDSVLLFSSPKGIFPLILESGHQ